MNFIDARKENYHEMELSPARAIKLFCKQCMGGTSSNAVVACESEKTCPLWRFRRGGNAYREKREMDPELKAAAIERFAKMREAKANG